jgi:tRNA pseudouridine38-40 synthase
LRYRATIAYDGTDFWGWQRQVARRTVQGELEAALSAISGNPAAVVGAGRTDIGVHATGQVAHFDIEWAHSPEALAHAVNAALARDVAVWQVAEAAPDFHARFHAIGRRYRYTLWVAPVRSPLARRTSLHVPQPLAVEAMADAAARFVGAHDLGAFGRALTPGGPTVRRIERCAVRRVGDYIWIDVDGNAFLRHQVRRMVGVLLDVGRGRTSPEAVSRALGAEPGAVKPRRVPAQGLTLVAILYGAGDEGHPGWVPGAEQGERNGEDVYAEEG